jgi:hypothetical protein
VSLRDQILAADDITSESVEIPEWKVTVEVRGMTGGDRAALMDEALDPETGNVDLQKIYPDAVILTAYDPTTSERVFGPEDRADLMAKSGVAIDRLASVAMRLSGFDGDAVDKAGKGSSSTKTDGTSTD